MKYWLNLWCSMWGHTFRRGPVECDGVNIGTYARCFVCGKYTEHLYPHAVKAFTHRQVT